MSDWAAEVTHFPIRRASLSGLDRLSEARGLGLDRRELLRLQAYYRTEGREPTDVELAGIAQSWSEHCSYKSSRPFLKLIEPWADWTESRPFSQTLTSSSPCMSGRRPC